MNKINHLTILLLLVFVKATLTQNAPITYAPNVICEPGSQLDIPITVKDFNNIGALSLTLGFDENVLGYQSFTNNSNFPGLLVYEQTPGKITAGGLIPYGSQGLSLADNSVLFTLTFNCFGGATSLNWIDDGGSCEYANDQYYPLNDLPTCNFYTRGTVNYTTISLDLIIFLEGPYSEGEMVSDLNNLDLIPPSQPYSASPWFYGCSSNANDIPSEAIDWILVELRVSPEGPAYATINKRIAEDVGFLMSDGTIKQEDGMHNLQVAVPTVEDLYIVVYHRNHISVIASSPLTIINGVGVYDFSENDQSVWGGDEAHKNLAPGVWGMVAGDCNGDGMVNLQDKDSILDTLFGCRGYLKADLTFDSQVDNQDKNDFWVLNSGFFSKVP